MVVFFCCKGGIKLILAITRENEKLIYEVCKENEFETPQVLTPLEREQACRRKIANKYDSYITAKLLPGLEK